VTSINALNLQTFPLKERREGRKREKERRCRQRERKGGGEIEEERMRRRYCSRKRD